MTDKDCRPHDLNLADFFLSKTISQKVARSERGLRIGLSFDEEKQWHDRVNAHTSEPDRTSEEEENKQKQDVYNII